jgi:hypothetical protein
LLGLEALDEIPGGATEKGADLDDVPQVRRPAGERIQEQPLAGMDQALDLFAGREIRRILAGVSEEGAVRSEEPVARERFDDRPILAQ